jgi:hypothetical protein
LNLLSFLSQETLSSRSGCCFQLKLVCAFTCLAEISCSHE